MTAARIADLPDLATVEEVQPFLRLGRRQMYEALRRGDIPHIRIGRSIRIPRTALEALINAANTTGTARGVEPDKNAPLVDDERGAEEDSDDARSRSTP